MIRKRTLKDHKVQEHSARRFKERLGIGLDDRTRRMLISDIRSGKAEFMRRQSNRVTVWRHLLPSTGDIIILIYDKIRGNIVTVWKEQP